MSIYNRITGDKRPICRSGDAGGGPLDPRVRPRHRRLQAQEEANRRPLPEGPEADVRGAVRLEPTKGSSKDHPLKLTTVHIHSVNLLLLNQFSTPSSK